MFFTGFRFRENDSSPNCRSATIGTGMGIRSYRLTASFLTLLLHSVFAYLFSSFLYAADFSGSVVGVLDGDTIEVLHNQHPERIRLSGIDCPEKGRAHFR